MEKGEVSSRLGAFEGTIQAVVRKYRSCSHTAGIGSDDLVQTLRIGVWEILEERGDAPRAYVCRAIWNRARDLLRLSARQHAAGYIAGRTISGRPIYASAQEVEVDSVSSDPWSRVDSRMHLESLMAKLRPEDAEVLYLTAMLGNRRAGERLRVAPSTLKRRLVRARRAAREVMGACAT